MSSEPLFHLRFRCLFCLFFLWAVVWTRGAEPQFNISEKGIRIEKWGSQPVTLSPQSFTRGSAQEKPLISLLAPDRTQARYPSGAVLSFQVKGQEVYCKYADVPKDGKSFKFSMTLPIRFNQGARFCLDDGSMAPFPLEKGEQIIQRGNGREFTVIDPQGQGFTLASPHGYQQVQDNRAFGTLSFSYSFKVDIGGKKEGAFILRLKPLENGITSAAPPPPKFLVDRYGQSATKDFPGKVTSDAEWEADAEKQLLEMKSFVPDSRLDSYGGLAGSGDRYKLRKTGYFHVHEVDGRKVLVDPDGNLFFQLGVCGITNTDDYTLVKGRENVFEWLPEKGGEFDGAWRESPKSGIFSFYIANWIRKFGKPFDREEWTGQVTRRLRSWGFNSAGAFSTYTEKMREMNLPYVTFLPLSEKSGIPTLPDKIGAAKVPDPFAPGIEEKLEEVFASRLPARARDPLLIGYFLGNEQHFETLPKVIPTYDGTKVPAKSKLVDMLEDKYGNIDAFNKAWDAAKPLPSFEAARKEPLFVRTDAAAEDMHEYFRLYLKEYYSLVERVFRKHDQNHLLLGSRWTPGTASNRDVVEIGSRHLDVISINYYSYGIEEAFFKKLEEWSGSKAVILSEWHYGTVEHGLAAHVEVKDQKERGAAFRNYLEQSAAIGTVVGSQWFIYTDQAITGRFFQGFNGEGNNTGLVDVADRPYVELVDAAKLSHARIYDVMLGKEKPFILDDPRFDGRGGSGETRMAQAPRAGKGMKLDGSSIGWPSRPAIPIESNRVVRGNPDKSFRGDFRLCWDETNLYFHILVKDPTPLISNKTGAGIYAGDAVEIFLGPRALDKTGSPIFSDRQILVKAAAEPEVYVTDHKEEAAQYRAVVTKEVGGDGYALLLVAPWKALNVEPKPGMEMLFDVAIDNSEDGNIRKQQAVWNGTAGNSKNRGVWGRMTLVNN